MGRGEVLGRRVRQGLGREWMAGMCSAMICARGGLRFNLRELQTLMVVARSGQIISINALY